MLKTPIIHPELMQALGEAGHGARILVADSNYPVTVKANPESRIVFLNFTPGTVSGTDIIRALAQTLVFESALFMAPPDGKTPPVVNEYRKLLPKNVPFESSGRFEFYDEASGPDTSLVIASGEQRVYANLLLTVGVIPPPKGK
ncbi:MAG: RbsD/FucU family protein [Planctomycetota bacterium]|jgi:L-fucose mutarotase|nr:RbsD/FucU family protein [Planctomycetota bacterium]